MLSRGKKFEAIFKKSVDTIADAYCLRLYDNTSGFSGISNPCDFIVYRHNTLYLCELKSTQNNVLNFANNIRDNQWQSLLAASKIDGIKCYIICWYVEKGITNAYNIIDLESLKQSGEKSIRYDSPYAHKIDSKVKRVYCDYDFNSLFT